MAWPRAGFGRAYLILLVRGSKKTGLERPPMAADLPGSWVGLRVGFGRAYLIEGRAEPNRVRVWPGLGVGAGAAARAIGAARPDLMWG